MLLPLFVAVTVSVLPVPTFTFPKLRLVGLTASWRFDPPPPLAEAMAQEASTSAATYRVRENSRMRPLSTPGAVRTTSRWGVSKGTKDFQASGHMQSPTVGSVGKDSSISIRFG